MPASLNGSRSQMHAHAEAMLYAIASAEQIIVSTIERECEAVRTGRMLAAKALHTRLCDAARMYLSVMRAAKTGIVLLNQVAPGISDHLEERRAAFASVLRVELAVLAAEGAARREAGAARMEKQTTAAGDRRPAARLVAIPGGRMRANRKAS